MQEDQLTEFLLKGTIDKMAYDGQLWRIRGNRDALFAQTEELRMSHQDTFMESVKTILELATSAKALWIRRSPQERKRVPEYDTLEPSSRGRNTNSDYFVFHRCSVGRLVRPAGSRPPRLPRSRLGLLCNRNWYKCEI